MSVERKMYEAMRDMISTWIHQAKTEDKIDTLVAYDCLIHALTRSINDLHEARYSELKKELKAYKDEQVTIGDLLDEFDRLNMLINEINQQKIVEEK